MTLRNQELHVLRAAVTLANPVAVAAGVAVGCRTKQDTEEFSSRTARKRGLHLHFGWMARGWPTLEWAK
jgi:hypothetical protein